MGNWQTYLKQWHWRADRVGEASLEMMAGARRFSGLFMSVMRVFFHMRWISRPAVMNVVIRQVYFTGVQSLPWIVMIALATGGLAVYNIVAFAYRVQDLSLIGSLMNGILVQEIAPFLVAIFLLARSGVAVVTEVGHMQSRGEAVLLRSLGISPHEYLYMPRVVAFSLCGLVLTFVFVTISVWAGGVVVSWSNTLNFGDFLFEVQRGTSLEAVITMIVKGMLYPMLSCMVLLDQGSCVGTDPNEVPVRAAMGFLGALMLMLMLDAVWVLIWNL